MGKMEDLSHYFYLGENNKGENSIKSDYGKRGSFDPKNRLKEVDNI